MQLPILIIVVDIIVTGIIHVVVVVPNVSTKTKGKVMKMFLQEILYIQGWVCSWCSL